MPYAIPVRLLVVFSAFAVMYQLLRAQERFFEGVSGAPAPSYDPAPPEPDRSTRLQCIVLFPSACMLAPSIRSGMASRVLLSFLVLGAMPGAALAGDLSNYRNFQFGWDVAAVARLAGVSASDVKVIHRRPALIQELAWRPQPLGRSAETESVKDVVFSFYDGQLFRMAISYDRYATEGMTAKDLIEAISANYGIAVKPPPAEASAGRFGDDEQVVARWQDPLYSFDLFRSTYWPSFRLVGTLKKLQATAQAAITEAVRLDDKEAPARDAERILREKESQQAKLEKVRLVNKPKFRP